MTPPDLDRLSAWQYELPPELIAVRPPEQRDAARLMVVHRRTGTIEHRRIAELPDLLATGDLLVFNNTQVLPARLFGFRTATGGKWEGLFIEESAPGIWNVLSETRGRLQPGETVTIIPAESHSSWSSALPATASFRATLISRRDDGSWLIRPDDQRSPLEVLKQYGGIPLPPYMGRKVADESDRQRYQTLFASQPGAVAAPTAGLHFTSDLLQRCQQIGVRQTELTLHVGIGTFRPVTVDHLSEHQMHDEWCRLPQSAVDQIEATRTAGGRIVAVGTTSVRTLEAAAAAHPGQPVPQAWTGRTQLFIRPGYRFQSVDCLLTNFHLPGSTLIVLVAALAGYELIMEAYRQAIEQRYRFYSYGDAMLIV